MKSGTFALALLTCATTLKLTGTATAVNIGAITLPPKNPPTAPMRIGTTLTRSAL